LNTALHAANLNGAGVAAALQEMTRERDKLAPKAARYDELVKVGRNAWWTAGIVLAVAVLLFVFVRILPMLRRVFGIP
jgi:predicted membrane-bound mannosyltransferase